MLRGCFQPHILRQLIGNTLSGWMSFVAGFSFGFSAVLLPELKNDDSFPYNDDLGSWIASITPLSMIVGCVCCGPLIDRFGRKIGHIIIAVLAIIGWLTIALATNVTLLLIGRFITGVTTGSTRTLSLVYLGEITEPKYRSFSLVCPSLTLNVGILVGHIIGEYISWKTSSFIYAAANLLCLMSLFFLKESPLWLISKGNIVEGIQSFKLFRGKGIESEEELNLVLQRQNEKSNKDLLKEILSKSFIKPFLTTILLSGATQINGLNSLIFYAKDILGDTVKGEVDPFIMMIMFDILRILTFVIIFFCNKFIPRKVFFIGVSFFCSVVLFGLFACLSFMNVSKFLWLSVTLIVLYIIFGGIIVALGWSFVPELFSGNLRGLGSGMSASISFILLFVYVKISPSFIANNGVNAMYAGFGVATAINTIILCFLLPETNGRTLQDIEDSYKK